MDDKEIAALVAALAPVIKGQIDATTAPLLARLAAVETRAPEAGAPGRDGLNGKDADPALIERLVATAVADLPKPRDGIDGKSVSIDEVRPLIEAEITRAVAAQPKAKDGADGIGIAGALIDRNGELVVTLSNGQAKNLGPVVGASVAAEAVEKLAGDIIAKEIARLPKPVETSAVTPETVRSIVAEVLDAMPKPERGEKGDTGIQGAPGRDADEESIAEAVMDRVIEELKKIPVPKDGKDGTSGADGKDADADAILAEVLKRVDAHIRSIPVPKDGVDGKSVSLDEVRPVLSSLVDAAVSAMPKPERGERGEKGDTGAPGANGERGETGAPGLRGERGEAGPSGLSVKGFLRDSNDHLIVTMSDGTTADLGLFVGKDGEPGRAGDPGRDGADGIGFDDLEVVETEKGVFIRFAKGERIKDFRLPVVRDCGTYKLGSVYGKGDGITDGGSFWIAQKDGVTEKPGAGAKDDWRLAVKRGRDARDPISFKPKE